MALDCKTLGKFGAFLNFTKQLTNFTELYETLPTKPQKQQTGTPNNVVVWLILGNLRSWLLDVICWKHLLCWWHVGFWRNNRIVGFCAKVFSGSFKRTRRVVWGDLLENKVHSKLGNQMNPPRCMLGLTSKVHKIPQFKPTFLASNSAYLLEAFGNGAYWCDHSHQHQAIQGSEGGMRRSTWAQKYPELLCRKIASVALRHWQDEQGKWRASVWVGLFN